MPPGIDALLVLAAGDPHQTAIIPQIVLQGSLLTELQVGSRRKPSPQAGGGADQLQAGHLAGVVELDQPLEAPLKAAGQGIRPG